MHEATIGPTPRLRTARVAMVVGALVLGLTTSTSPAAAEDEGLPASVDTFAELVDWAVDFTAADFGQDDVARVERWFGPEVRAIIETVLSTMIATPPAERDSNAAAILDELTVEANQRARDVYSAAVDEARAWRANDCTYDPGPGIPYVRPERCDRSPLEPPTSNARFLLDLFDGLTDGTELVPTLSTFVGAAYGEDFEALWTAGGREVSFAGALAIANGAALALGGVVAGGVAISITSGLSAAMAAVTAGTATTSSVLGPVFGGVAPFFFPATGATAAAVAIVAAPIVAGFAVLAVIGTAIWATVEMVENDVLRDTLVDRMEALAQARAAAEVPFEAMLRQDPALEGEAADLDGMEASIAQSLLTELMSPDPVRAPFAVVLDGCDRYTSAGVGDAGEIQQCSDSVAAALGDRPGKDASDPVFRDLGALDVQHSPLSVYSRVFDPEASPEDEDPFWAVPVDVYVTDETFAVDRGSGAQWASSLLYYGRLTSEDSSIRLLSARIVPADGEDPLRFLVTDTAFTEPEAAQTLLTDELEVLSPAAIARGHIEFLRVGLGERLHTPTFEATVVDGGTGEETATDPASTIRMAEGDEVWISVDDFGSVEDGLVLDDTMTWAFQRPSPEYESPLTVDCSPVLPCFEPETCDLRAGDCPDERYHYATGPSASFAPGDDSEREGALVAHVFAYFQDGTPYEQTFLIEVVDELPTVLMTLNGDTPTPTIPPTPAVPQVVSGVAQVGVEVGSDPGSHDMYEVAAVWGDGLVQTTHGLTYEDCSTSWETEDGPDLTIGSGSRSLCNLSDPAPNFLDAADAADPPWIWRAVPDGFGDQTVVETIRAELRARAGGTRAAPEFTVIIEDPAITHEQVLTVEEEGALSLNRVFDTIEFDDPTTTPMDVDFRFEHRSLPCTLAPAGQPGADCLTLGTIQPESVAEADGTVEVCVPVGEVECPTPYSYRPLPNANGTDLLEYSFCISGQPANLYGVEFGGCIREHAYVEVVIEPTNDPVVATDVSRTTDEDATAYVRLEDLFADVETAMEDLDLTFDTAASPLVESVAVGLDPVPDLVFDPVTLLHLPVFRPAVVIEPSADASGTVDVAVTATDGGDPHGCVDPDPCDAATSATATVSLTIAPVPDVPTVEVTGPTDVFEALPYEYAYEITDADLDGLGSSPEATVAIDGTPSCGTGTLDAHVSAGLTGTFTCVFPAGDSPTEVSVSAIDELAQIGTGTLPVTVSEDTGIPVLSDVPSDLVVDVDGAGPVAVTFDAPTAVDVEAGDLPVTCDPASGDAFPVGTTTVTCSAEDPAGNMASATFTVTVSDPPPVVDDVEVTVVDGWGADVVVPASDGNSATLTHRVTDLPTKGIVHMVGDALRYVADWGASGVDTVGIEVCDLTSCATGTVTVTIESFQPPTTLPIGLPGGLLVDPSTFEAGDWVRVSVTGALPGEWVRVMLFSDPVQLGAFQANALGVLDVPVQMPDDLTPGSHTLVAYSSQKVSTRSVTVVPPADTDSGDESPEDQTSGDGSGGDQTAGDEGSGDALGAPDASADGAADDQLPLTGAGADAAGRLALLFLVLGALLLAGTRSRGRRLA